jgi:hypothetical protein
VKSLRLTKGTVALLLATVAASVLYLVRMTPSVWDSRGIAALSDGTLGVGGQVVSAARVTVSGFASLINKVEFVVGPVRGESPGQDTRIAYSMCDSDERTVDARAEAMVAARIPFGCSPLRISFRSVSAASDDSAAASNAQIRRLSVTSFMTPWPSLSRVITFTAAIGLMVFLSLFLVRGGYIRSYLPGYGVLIGVVGFALLTGLDAKKFAPLWLCVVAVLSGCALARCADSSGTDGWGSRAWIWYAVALGGSLRFYGIYFGLPSNFHPDEVPKVNAIMRLVEQNTWDPQYFLHPSLLLYLTYCMNCVIRTLGVDGTFRESAFLAGRLVSALAGTASIFVLYDLARRLYSRQTAVASAFILAVVPLHVTCSRYLKEDALLTLCALTCALAVIVAVKSNRPWMLLIAGFLAGCTAGTKYSGILMSGVIVAAPWIVSRSWTPDRRWLPWAVAGVVIAPLGFLCTTPFSLINSTRFLHDFAAESRHMRSGHTQSIDAWSQLWMYHFSRSIIPGMTSITALLSVAGLGLLARRRKVEDLIVVGLFLLFYLPAEFVKAKPAPQPERYIVPCLPFLAVALGELWRIFATKVRVRGGGAVALALLVALPCMRTVALASEITRDTRDLMADWMRVNVPAGSKVLMDWQPYCPRFHHDEFSVEYIPRATIIPKLDLKYLRNSHADYLILSNLYYDRYFKQPESNPLLRQRIREVFERVPVKLQYAPTFGTYGFHNPVVTLFSLKREDFESLDRELALKRERKISETSNDVLARRKW